MTVTINPIIPSTDNFADWLAKTNQALVVLSNNAVTVNSNNAIGVAGITGSFSANVIYSSDIRGGVYGNAANISFTSNTIFTSNAAFLSNVSYSGTNNSFGSVSSIFIPGANSTNKFLASNNFTGKTYHANLLSEIVAIDGIGSGLDADLLDGQQGSYYTDVVSRLGYTPVDKSGDVFIGNVAIATPIPTINLHSTTSSKSVNIRNVGGKFIISNTNTIEMLHSTAVSNTVNITSLSTTLIDQFDKGLFKGAKYIVCSSNNNANARSISELLVVHDNGDALMTEYAQLNTNTAFVSFTANTDATSVRLYGLSTSNNATITYICNML